MPSELVDSGISSLLILFLAQKRGQNMAAYISLGFGALVGKKGANNGGARKRRRTQRGIEEGDYRRHFHLPTSFLGFAFSPATRLHTCMTNFLGLLYP